MKAGSNFEKSATPITDALIDRMMREHPGVSAKAQADYYEAVHQELAPLARDFEKQIAGLKAGISFRENNQKDWHGLVIKIGCMFDFDTTGSVDEVAVSAAARRDANIEAKEGGVIPSRCISNSGPSGCYRVRCQLGRRCAETEKPQP